MPRPLTNPVEFFQPVTSPATLTYAAKAGHTGVFALGSHDYTKGNWDRFGEECTPPLAPGQRRCLQLIVHVGRTTKQAIERARPGLDEHVKFLSQYGRFRNLEPGAPFTYRPSVEDVRRVRAMAIGSVEEVVDVIGEWRDLLSLRHLAFFPELPGLTGDEVDEQLQLMAAEVLPRLGVHLG